MIRPLTVLTIFSIAAVAGPVPCPTTATFADYLALNSNATPGCFIGDKLFTDFSFNSEGVLTPAFAASDFTVTPITGPDIGLSFSGSFSAGVLQTVDTNLRYQVQTTDGVSLIEDNTVAIAGTISGLAQANLQETEDATGTLLPIISDVSLNDSTSAHTTFDPTMTVSVGNDFFVGGGASGSVDVTSFSETFSQVSSPVATPEPASFLLIALSIPLVALTRRRKSSSQGRAQLTRKIAPAL